MVLCYRRVRALALRYGREIHCGPRCSSKLRRAQQRPAKLFLDHLWGAEPSAPAFESVTGPSSTEWDDALALADSSLASVLLAIRTGWSAPGVGQDLGPDNEWQVELAWPNQRIAVVVDQDIEREA